MAVTYDTDMIRTINMFESVTGVEAIHAIVEDEEAYFIVPEGKAGMAIGKGGETVKKLQRNMDKNVKIYEYSDNIGKFLNNLVPTNIRGVNIEGEDGDGPITVEINVPSENKGRVVGRDGKKIESIRHILKRTHNVDEVTVN
ncbi:NusA-like transcription termination signal-binding factor [Candidatus Nanohalococcus occultus]|uniref:Probable transcription termination protein NusA n=1 Tax=Candidatus Nanohalococcus occultus TaxID=2978047 RepID=A0ABY8CFG4_9ARCH|nr:Transcription elongation factor [Candidatus Nanohaloarchaeota archaeon SVXNc]